MFRDKDGSLGGGPNSYVLIHDGVNDSIAVDAQACEIKPAWNAAVCKGDVGRMNVGGPGGGGRGACSWRCARWRPRCCSWCSAGARGGPGAAPDAALLLARGAAAGRGGPGAGPGGRGGWAAPAQPPVILSRNGKEYT